MIQSLLLVSSEVPSCNDPCLTVYLEEEEEEEGGKKKRRRWGKKRGGGGGGGGGEGVRGRG